jgi:lantibiotic modifying enzyme
MSILKQKVIVKIEEIYHLMEQFIENGQLPDHELSLFEGKSGAALFFYQYAHYNPQKKEECYEKINYLIDDAFEYISETADVKTSYCDGLTGILWLTQFLRNKGVIAMEEEDIPAEIIDELSAFSIVQSVDQLNCDLLHGGFGFWAFLLESRELPGKEKLLRDQLNALNKITVPTAEGYNWKIDQGIFKKNDNEDTAIDAASSTHLGLAHGVSSILVLLAKTRMQGYFEQETIQYIHKGLTHLKSLKIKDKDVNYLYPMVVLNDQPQQGGRLAWCNGDLSVAHAFWMGWKATHCEDYKTEALQIVDNVLKLNKQHAGVKDAGLCHGAAGIAQIFKRFYWETGDEVYAKVADEWITTSLEMATYKDGYAGYKTFASEAYGGPYPEYGFLSGVAGIGLSLLSSLSETPTEWDRVLQIC